MPASRAYLIFIPRIIPGDFSSETPASQCASATCSGLALFTSLIYAWLVSLSCKLALSCLLGSWADIGVTGF